MQTKLAAWVQAQPESVGEIARRLGVHRVTLHRYMAGGLRPKPAIAKAIEKATGGAVTLRDMLLPSEG